VALRTALGSLAVLGLLVWNVGLLEVISYLRLFFLIGAPVTPLDALIIES
jgi:hypothetical protein